MTERIAKVALGVLVGSWVARHLGPANYGELAYVVALVAFFQALSSLGLDSIVVRNLSQTPEDSARFLGVAFRLRLGAGVIAWLATAGSVAALRPGDHEVLLMASLLGLGLVLQSTEVVELWFQSRSRSKVTVGAKLLAYISSSAIKVALILLDTPLWTFAVAQLADFACAAVALTWAYRREPAPKRWCWDRDAAWLMLREALPLMLAALSVVVYMRIDQLILRTLASERELGLYSAIIPFSQAWHMVPVTICASLLPRFSVLRQTDVELYRCRLQQLFSLMAWLGVAVAILTTVLAPWLVSFLLGPAYHEAIRILQWHALGNIFVFLGVAQSVAIVSDRTPLLSLFKTLGGATASVALNMALVPNWGAIGAAWASVGSFFCAAVLTNAVFSRASLSMQFKAFWPFHAQRS